MNLVKSIFVFLLIFGFANTSYAEQVQEEQSKAKGTKVSIMPYAWLTGLKGTVGTATGHSTSLDLSFSDIRNSINSAGMITAEVEHNNKFGVIANFNLADLGEQVSQENANLGVDVKMRFGDIAGFYRVASTPLSRKDSFVNFDVLAGVRFWDVSLDLNLDTLGFGSQKFSRSRNWSNPFVGARTDFHLSDQWRITLQGGVGRDSSWDTSVLVGYTFAKNTTLVTGYRTVRVDRREDDGFIFDAKIQGPIFGLIFVF